VADAGTSGSAARQLDALLLNAKVSIPNPRPGAVSRADLIGTARASNCRVVGVTAPAGYGKSTLLTEWANAEDRPVAWVSLDRLDNDPAVLLPLLASAFAPLAPDGAELIADMSGFAGSALARAAPRLASAFNTNPNPFVLMVDDLHELQSPTCHDVLSVAISGIPRSSQFVAASRAEQPHLPRLRASGDAIELLASDLAIDASGAQQIFAEASVSLSPELAASVTARTEGWPAGLYLAALIAKESNDEGLGISGDDRYIADYLYRESFMQLPDVMQVFLRRTAVLDEMSGSLCDALLNSSDGHNRLRQLEASHLFLVPLDRRREWYRYHALFREFLLAELRRVEPNAVEKLQLRAADWYETYGSKAKAIEHLLNTTERDRCVHLVTEMALPTYKAGLLSTLQRWMSAVGDPAIRSYPPLAVLAGWIATLTAHTADAQRWAAISDAALFDLVPADGSASFASARAMLRTFMCAGGPEQALADGLFAVGAEPAWSPWRDTALVGCGEAYLLAGDADSAAAMFAESSALAATFSNHDSIVLSESELALLAMEAGRWSEAAERIELALARIKEFRLHDYATCVMAFVAAARLAVHRGDLKEVDRQVTRAMRARPSLTFTLPFLAVRVRLQLAIVCCATADHTTARHLLREIDDVLLQRPELGTLVGEVEKLRQTLTVAAPGGASGAPPLTPAELRLLPYLQTHLTLREIAERLFVSRNTVSSQLASMYRKLGVSSRSEAVTQATAVGLLGA
jgi:LuxR family maltose regulon positive regulatory protein